MNNFDYHSLAEPISYKEATALLPKIDTKYQLVYFAFGVFGLIVMAALFFGEANRGELVPVFIAALVFAALPSMYYWFHRRNTVRAAKVYRFAKDNNLDITLVQESAHDRAGAIFQAGHERRIMAAVGKPGQDGFEIGTYRYVTGGGRSARTHNYTYLQATLNRHLPNLLIDAKKNNTSRLLTSDAPEYVSNNQKLSVEGNFNETHTVYTPKGYEQDALQILTPDVLQGVLDHAQEWDVEIVDDKLILFTPEHADLSSQEVLETLFAKLAFFDNMFTKRSAAYIDTRIADRSVRTVAPQGQRLKQGIGLFTWLVLGYIVINLLVRLVYSIFMR